MSFCRRDLSCFCFVQRHDDEPSSTARHRWWWWWWRWRWKTDDGNLHVDHALQITFPSAFSSSMERNISNALKSFDKACGDISRSITIMGYAGEIISWVCWCWILLQDVMRCASNHTNTALSSPLAAAYLLMAGLSKLIEARIRSKCLPSSTEDDDSKE